MDNLYLYYSQRYSDVLFHTAERICTLQMVVMRKSIYRGGQNHRKNLFIRSQSHEEESVQTTM